MPDLPTFDDPALDTQLQRYYAELDALTAQALAGELEERDFVAEMERVVGAIILLMFLMGGGSTAIPGAEQVLEARRREHRRSIRRLAVDIYGGRYQPAEGETVEASREKLRSRLTLWLGAAAALYREGQVHQEPRIVAGERREPVFTWRRGPTERGCRDCVALDGVTLTASEWRRIGLTPQSPDLSCGGWNCLCRLVETEESSLGFENVPVA